METTDLSTIQHLSHPGGSSRLLPWPKRLASALLLFLLAVSFGQSPPQGAVAQERNPRFTASLLFQEISPGIEYGQVSSGQQSKDESTGPWLINVLRIDLTKSRVRIVRALDEGVGMETVSSLAARHRAVAAINGGYFRTTGTYRGESLGFLLLDGKFISESHNDRAVVGVINSRDASEVIFGHLKSYGEIRVGAAKHTVQGVNRPVSPNELLIFSPDFHRTTLTNPDGIEVIVRRNRVVAIEDLKGSSQIPPDGFVISASGSARDWIKQNVRWGSIARFSWRMSPLEPEASNTWRNAGSILGGGPQLVKDGKVSITSLQENITHAFVTDLHPRTAIAKLNSGELVLVTVDGRRPGVSVGMSLPTLAELLLELGAVDAINLDGGGSTTMVVRDKVVNRPSDQTGERPVSDAILVFSK
jgi:exopolysaccharide biosynthesis protein